MTVLTARELEVLRLLCDGLQTKEIADRLGISFYTARHHCSAIHHKAGIPGPGPVLLFRWAIESGYVQAPRRKT
jgi:DNA-binding NarL/FixJ family response regulator